MRNEPHLVGELAATRRRWARYSNLVEDMNRWVNEPSRGQLDREIDASFARAVLKRSNQRLFLGVDRRLRPQRASRDDQEITLANAVRRFGGKAVEAAFEFGSELVAGHQTRWLWIIFFLSLIVLAGVAVARRFVPG